MARRSIDREAIGAVALELADEGGLAAVTARNLAERLGVTPMALYRHVPNLGAVIDGLLERVLVEARVLQHASPTLDAFLVETFTRIHACLVAHPAVLPLVGTSVGYGPAGLSVVEAALGRLAVGGHSPATSVRIFHALLSYTIGAASVRAAVQSRTGIPSREAVEDLPYVRAAIVPLTRFASDRSFRAGLALVLDAALATESEEATGVSSTSRRRPTARRAT